MYKFHSQALKLDKTQRESNLHLRIFNLQSEDYILRKLLLFTTMLVALCFAPAQAADINSVKVSIAKHAIEMGVDPAIALSIARTESGFNHGARSSHGAVGVFQLMPSTAKRMGLNPYLLNDNIKGGIMYYKSMYKMFGSVELALAAYNAGPGNVKRYQAVPPYSETKRFVSKIMTDYNYYKANSDPAIKAAKAAIAQQSAAKQQQTAKAQIVQVKPTQQGQTTSVQVKPVNPSNTLNVANSKIQQTTELAKVQKAKSVKVEIIDETPLELEIEAKSLAI